MNNPTKALFTLLLDDAVSEDEKCQGIDALFKADSSESKASSQADIPEINFITPVIQIAPVSQIHAKLESKSMISPACLPLIKNQMKVLNKLIHYGANLHLPLSIAAFHMDDAKKTRAILLNPLLHIDMYQEFLPTVALGKQTDNHASRFVTTNAYTMMYVKWQVDKTVNSLKALHDGKFEAQLYAAIDSFQLAMKTDAPFALNYIHSRILRVNLCSNSNEQWYLHDLLTILTTYLDLPGKRSLPFQQAFTELLKALEEYNPESHMAEVRIFETLGERDQFVCKYAPITPYQPDSDEAKTVTKPPQTLLTPLGMIKTMQQNASPASGPLPAFKDLPVVSEQDEDDYHIVAGVGSVSLDGVGK